MNEIQQHEYILENGVMKYVWRRQSIRPKLQRGKLERFQTRRSQYFRLSHDVLVAPACLKSPKSLTQNQIKAS